MAQVRGYSCLCWFSLWLWHHSLSGAISYKSHIMISLFGHKWLVLFPDARLCLSQGIICMCAKLMRLSHCHAFRNVINIAIYAANDQLYHTRTHITTKTSLRLCTYGPPIVWCILLTKPESIFSIWLDDYAEILRVKTHRFRFWGWNNFELWMRHWVEYNII